MIAIVAALREELAGYLAHGGFELANRNENVRCYSSAIERRVVVVEGGVGRRRAEAATRLAVERFSPDFIISAGFAGGVKPGLNTGDLFLCDRVWSVEGPPDSWTLEAALSRSVADEVVPGRLNGLFDKLGTRFRRGDCLTAPELVPSSSLKRWVGATFPVNIVDMESFWVSQTAEQFGVPCIVVRSVLDPVEQTLPPFVAQVAAGGDKSGWLYTLRYVLARPTQIPGLIRVASQARVARDALATILRALAAAEIPSPAI